MLPSLFEQEDPLAVYLESRVERYWCLTVADRGANDLVTANTREDLMFLTGACARQLFFHGLAEVREERAGKVS